MLQDGGRIVPLRKATTNVFAENCWEAWLWLMCLTDQLEIWVIWAAFFRRKKLSCSCQSQEFHPQDVTGTIPKNSQVILRNTWIDETPKPPAHLSLNTSLVLHPMNTQPYGVWKIPCVLSIADLPVLTAINGYMSNILYGYRASEAPETSMNHWSYPKRLVVFGTHALLEDGSHLYTFQFFAAVAVALGCNYWCGSCLKKTKTLWVPPPQNPCSSRSSFTIVPPCSFFLASLKLNQNL